MNNIKEMLDKYALNPYRYTIKNSVNIVGTEKGLFVLKKKKRKDLDSVFTYLKSRGFSNMPNMMETDERDEYDIYEYIDEVEEPKEQKAIDIIYVLTLLHNKTTFFSETQKDQYKEIYEEITNYLNYIYNYYNDIISVIENEIYMSPSRYLLAQNISKVFYAINYCSTEIKKWYRLVENQRKRRLATIHNNVELNHIVKNNDPYLISWDQCDIDSPIKDFLCFYKNNYNDLDFSELLKLYESKYPLSDDERLLLFIMMSIPAKIEFDGNELSMCRNINKMLDYLFKTDELIAPYYAKNAEEETSEENK